MSDVGDHLVERWTVDYGDAVEPEQIVAPHAWRQDLPVTAEGPVIYRTSIEVPKTPSKLRFTGVSYFAEVSLNGNIAITHRGIWDAFDVSLVSHAGKRVDVAVQVIKNGGASYPIPDVASGFLPYVFNTFGGIFGEVSIVAADEPLSFPAPSQCRASSSGTQILVDGRPFYPRGLLHWGWYPELGHPNPPLAVIRREVRAAKELGFNLVKFCLWAPPHRYLEILKEEAMEAWLELPLWNPSSDALALAQIRGEVEQIVRQYRHHDNILIWSIGCELGASVPAPFLKSLTRLVRNLTGSELVKDNSGSAEMYGGDLSESGSYYDFHPYCEPQFANAVLDSLLPGSRTPRPTLLGETNDADVHRDLAMIGNEIPFWGSTFPELNDKGVRWQYELPEVLGSNRFAQNPTREGHRPLMESSRLKSLFMRKAMTERIRSHSPLSGYVVTGWRDTPISSAGFFDDWDEPRFTPSECASWNGRACLFIIPIRRPSWVRGGNRSGFVDSFNRQVGTVLWRIGIHSEDRVRGGLVWQITDARHQIVARGEAEFMSVEALMSTEIGDISWECELPGAYTLEVQFGATSNSWPIWVTVPFGDSDQAAWTTDDPEELLGFGSAAGALKLSIQFQQPLERGLTILTGEGTVGKPFWREAAYEFLNEEFWGVFELAERWERLLPISTDRVLSKDWLDRLGVPYEVLLRRIDVRTYEEDPLLVRAGDTFITTLRPFGGLGDQPSGIPQNAAGAEFVRAIAGLLT